MFSIEDLKDNKNFTYLFCNINYDIHYPKINLFDVYHNNELFNPFIDKLIDMNKSIAKCKFIEWFDYIDNYKHTKYNRYFNEWLNSINSREQIIHHNDITTVNYQYRDDNLMIKILYDIYDKEYLQKIYPSVNISQFTYLNILVNIIKIPTNAINYVQFDLYIHKPEENLCNYNQSIYITKDYNKPIKIYLISLNYRIIKLYKEYN